MIRLMEFKGFLVLQSVSAKTCPMLRRSRLLRVECTQQRYLGILRGQASYLEGLSRDYTTSDEVQITANTGHRRTQASSANIFSEPPIPHYAQKWSTLAPTNEGAGGAAKSSLQPKWIKYWNIAVEAAKHVWIGSKLLAKNTKIAFVLVRRIQNGEMLSKPERRLLHLAAADLFRMVPFSFFIIVPFAELLLPFALKIYPGLIPSTFESDEVRLRNVMKQSLTKLKALGPLHTYFHKGLITAGALKDPVTADVIKRLRCGAPIYEADVRALCSYFEKIGNLDDMPVRGLKIISKYLDLQTYYYYEGEHKMRESIKTAIALAIQEDRALLHAGVHNLPVEDLVKACDIRGLRWIQVSVTDMQQQLEEYLILSVDPKIPNLLLIYCRPKAPYSSTSPYAVSRLPKKQLDLLWDSVGSDMKAELLSAFEIPTSDARRIAEKAGLTAGWNPLVAPGRQTSSTLQRRLTVLKEEESKAREASHG